MSRVRMQGGTPSQVRVEGGCPLSRSGRGGTPSQVKMGVPLSGQDGWVPPLSLDGWGVPPSGRMGVLPHQEGWGTPHLGPGQGTPPPPSGTWLWYPPPVWGTPLSETRTWLGYPPPMWTDTQTGVKTLPSLVTRTRAVMNITFPRTSYAVGKYMEEYLVIPYTFIIFRQLMITFSRQEKQLS